MEPKKAKAGAAASAVGLALTDKQITLLCDKVLPHTPHLLSVPTKTPYMPVFPHENQCTPFDQWEVMQLQYMTLISNADRGVGYAHGNWEDAMNAKSPSSADVPSSTPTPNPARDLKKPAVKMSIADYKNLKTTGVKPSPRPSAATPESRPRHDAADRNPTHSRNASAVSVNTPMSRVPSFEGGDKRQNGIGASSKNERGLQNTVSKEDTLATQRTKPEARDADKPRAVINGNSASDSLRAKDTNKAPQPSSKPDARRAVKEPLKHPLPPRPQSPRRNFPESKPQKRPSESGDALHSEKRSKINHSDSKTTSNPPKPAPRKPEVTDTKPSPAKSQKPSQPTPTRASPHSKKATPTSIKPLETKSSSSKPSTSEKPLNLPPLLSPLPADLETPSRPSFESVKKSEAVKPAQPKIPSQNSKGIASDTIVVKQPSTKKDIPTSSPLSTPKSTPPFVLPRLLSPDLPDIVEAELLRLQQKSATLNSVEARHEKARQPGAPGVAQKRPKLGHPPKKSHAESSNSSKKVTVTEKEPEPLRLIVKMSYKKNDAKRVRDLLRLPARPWKGFKAGESAKRLDPEPSSSTVQAKDDSESEEDVPLAASRATKAPAPIAGKKRPVDSDRSEPPPKRQKGPENIDVAKASTPLAPPFKSPATNVPSIIRDHTVSATPKKADALKSVAMRKVDSNDGHAKTPQPTSTSTPASAEKPKMKTERVVDQEQLQRARAEEAKFYPLGTTLKRKMQAILASENITADEKKVGVMRGIESLMAYMLAFHFRDRVDILSSRHFTPNSWEQFFPIWNFVEQNTRQYPELRTLLEQLGAVSREQLTKIYTSLTEESRNWEKLISCLKQRDALWAQCKKNEKLLSALGIQGTLGPWSSVSEAVGFGVATLACYATAQRMQWDGDSHFSGAFSRQFMKQTPARAQEKKVASGSKDGTARDRDAIPDDIAALVG